MTSFRSVPQWYYRHRILARGEGVALNAFCGEQLERYRVAVTPIKAETTAAILSQAGVLTTKIHPPADLACDITRLLINAVCRHHQGLAQYLQRNTSASTLQFRWTRDAKNFTIIAKILFVTTLSTIAALGPAFAETSGCGFTKSFDWRDEQGKRTVNVYEGSSMAAIAGRSPFAFVTPLKVNTDGNRISYKVDDPRAKNGNDIRNAFNNPKRSNSGFPIATVRERRETLSAVRCEGTADILKNDEARRAPFRVKSLHKLGERPKGSGPIAFEARASAGEGKVLTWKRCPGEISGAGQICRRQFSDISNDQMIGAPICGVAGGFLRIEIIGEQTGP